MENSRNSLVLLFLLALLIGLMVVIITGCSTETTPEPEEYQPPQPDLYWCFDDDLVSGDTIQDVVNSPAYDGTTTAGVTTGQAGIVDQAVLMDGTSGYISAAPPKVDTLTISVWINPASIPADYTMIYCQGSGGAGYTGCYLSWRSTERVRFSVYDQGSIYHSVETLGAINTGEWTHIAATVIIDGASSKMSVYHDGVFQASDTFNATSIRYGANELCLGMNTFHSDFFFDGTIDEFVIFFDRVLSDEDIDYLYDMGKSGSPIVSHP